MQTNPELIAQAHVLADFIRWVVLAEVLASVIIHAWTLLETYRAAGSRNLRYGLMLRWIGHLLVSAGIAMFIVSRLGEPFNWFITPLVAGGLSILMVSTWLARAQDPIHPLKHESEVS